MFEVIKQSVFTPLGNLKQTCAAVQAGISVYSESNLYDRNRDRIKVCSIPEGGFQPLWFSRGTNKVSAVRARILNIAATALTQLLEDEPKHKIPLLLAAPEKLPGTRTRIDDRFFSLLTEHFSEYVESENSYVFPFGRAAFSKVLDAANLLMNDMGFEEIIIGGADSYLDINLLLSLEKDSRVLASNITDGFVPSEGASFLLIKKASLSSEKVISSWASTEESGHRYSEEESAQEALSVAVNKALTRDDTISNVYACLNGESYFAKEWGVAYMRNQSKFTEDVEILHPADCFGDLGAAWGPVMAGLALNRSSASTLICLSSDGKDRSAFVARGK